MLCNFLGMLVVAQNRFKTSGSASKGRMGKRQDSFHYEPPTEQGLLVPEQHQVRRHSTGNVAGTINIAELQQNLASSKTTSKVHLSQSKSNFLSNEVDFTEFLIKTNKATGTMWKLKKFTLLMKVFFVKSTI